MDNPKVAIIHDWLTGMRGGEKCLEVFCELFPDATLFTLLHKKGSVSPIIEQMDIRTSFLQRIPGIEKNYRKFLPLFPSAIESFDLSEYDLVLSSSHCVAKGVRTKPETLHICYCYTPMRYAWKFFNVYFSKESPLKKLFISFVIDRLKKWDLRTNNSVDNFIAISDNIKKRIKQYYSVDSDVIYPPVDTDKDEIDSQDKGYYLIVSALVPYKRVDLAVRAFNKTEKDLVIIGDGGDLAGLKKIAGKNIKFLGWVGDKELKKYYAGCRGLIFPGEEDFGIVPVEAQSYGKPVIAYGAGGALETVIPVDEDSSRPTGVFFNEQTSVSLNCAIELYETQMHLFDKDEIKKNAQKFSRDRFKREIDVYVNKRLALRSKS